MVASRPTASPQLLATGRRCLAYPDHLPRWRSALANARYRQAHILAVGDSITKGLYSNDSGATDEATWRVRGYAPQVRSLFADRYGDPGEGIVFLSDARVTKVGATFVSSAGIGLGGQQLDNGDTLTITLPACTTVKIYWYWDANATSAAFSYTIDGGAPVTAAAASGNVQYPIETVTGLADATHTLVISGPTTKYSFISCVGAYRQTTTGVALHRVSVAGGYLTDCFLSGTGTSAVRVNRLSFVQQPMDLAMIAFGANESSAGQPLGKTPALFASLLTDVTTYATANGTDCLIVAGPRRPPSAFVGLTYTDDDFYAAAKAVAAANPNVAYFDLKRIWGTFAAADALGLYQDAFIHPSLRGHSDYGKLVYEAIGGV